MTQSLVPGENHAYYWTRQGISLQELQEKFDQLLAVVATPGVDLGALSAAVAQAQAAAAAAQATAAGLTLNAPVQTVAGKAGNVTLVKGDVGLGNVDNTADANKPLSTTQQAYIDAAVAAVGGGGGGLLTSQSVTTDTTLSTTISDIVDVNSATAVAVTIPAGIPNGRGFEVYQAGAGQATLVAGAGVTLRVAAPSTGLKTPGQYGSVFVRSKSAGTFTAPSSTNLLMRYKGDDVVGANGAAVGSWPESSGNSLPAATQATGANQPLIVTNAGGTGHKGIAFDGVNDFMSLSGTALAVAQNRAGLTVFLVLVLPAVTTGTRTVLGLSSGTGATSHRLVFGTRESAGGLPYLGGRRLDADTLATITGTAGGLGTAQNVVMTGRWNYSAASVAILKNGAQLNSGTFQTAGSTSNTASLAGVIGADAATTTGNFQGTLLELLVYNDADVSGALRQQVHSYILQTYGLTSSDAQTAECIVSGGVS